MMNRKLNVLFVCVHNSARSVMAEALFNRMCGQKYHAQSAGLEPGTLNPLAQKVLAERGIDVSNHEPRSAFEVLKTGTLFTHVIAVCDGANAQRCPIFPGVTQRIHWSFPDPSSFTGTEAQKLEQTREVMALIEAQIESEFCAANCPLAA